MQSLLRRRVTLLLTWPGVYYDIALFLLFHRIERVTNLLFELLPRFST